MEPSLRWPTISRHWLELFGEKVWRVSLDPGFGCPNRDGALGKDGCIFCDPDTFALSSGDRRPIKEQLATSMEKLRRSGIRSLGAVVDITNYVLIELGQPMHAFDLSILHGAINVRRAKSQEKLVLLDGKELELDEDVLVIADEKQALAMAGIMGGELSGVGDATKDLFLEAAYFNPRPINVSRSGWVLKDGRLLVLVELRDQGYPGSTYTLAYKQDIDRLVGIYFQAAAQQQFEVVFERIE